MLRENIVCRKTEVGEKGTVVRVNVEDRQADVKLKESGSVIENVDEDGSSQFARASAGNARSCITMISSTRKVKF